MVETIGSRRESQTGHDHRKEKEMTRIDVYDYSCSRIEDIAAKFDLTVAEVIEIVLDNIDADEEEFIFGR